jgi:hypothetical protein
MSAELTPAFITWLEHQRRRGSVALAKIADQRRLLLGEAHGLERFAIRMALVNLTGLVAGWARGVHEGLSEAGHEQAAAAFALSPPFAESDPTTEDCERLGEYVEERVKLLEDLLAA